ncbi:unnamed protein product [Rotaria sp. Silwood2]|nr:unnamed protein product [Rotaria sp. Silwood2]
MTTSTFHAKSTAVEFVKGLNVNLHGKLVLITGGTPGIGIETARALEHISKTTTNNDKIEVMKLDLNSPQSVGDFVDQFRARHLPINILICNAGIMACSYGKTTEGFETQFGVNHLAHFLLATRT